jgi:hypothetical protein
MGDGAAAGESDAAVAECGDRLNRASLNPLLLFSLQCPRNGLINLVDPSEHRTSSNPVAARTLRVSGGQPTHRTPFAPESSSAKAVFSMITKNFHFELRASKRSHVVTGYCRCNNF